MLFQRALDTLREAKAELESVVSGGQLNDFEAYKYFSGRIQGLKDSIDIIQNIIKRGIDE